VSHNSDFGSQETTNSNKTNNSIVRKNDCYNANYHLTTRSQAISYKTDGCFSNATQ